MNKPIKPNITIPESFAENGIKTDFDDTLIADGFDSLRPDVLAGDNLNKFIDDTYKGLNYGMAAADAINLINEGETLTVKEGQLVSDKLGGGAGLQLFDTILKDHILTYEETKGLALQGTYVYKEALAGSRYGYPDFYNKVIEEFNEATATETVNGVTVKVNANGHKFYNIADKTAIDNFFNTMGSAWFYGVDTANERIFLPRDNYFAVKGVAPVAGNGMTLGLTTLGLNAGLTEMDVAGFGGSADLVLDTRAYGTSVNSTMPNYVTGQFSGQYKTVGVVSDPTKSGIEARLETNEDKYLYICVGNTTNYEGVTDVVNQGMEILEQVAQKVNVDGTNLTAEGKSLIASYAMPSSRYIDLTFGASGTQYTAPANGWFYCFVRCAYDQSISNITTGQIYCTGVYGNAQTEQTHTYNIPVKKGDIIQTNTTFPNFHDVTFKFIYAEGEV